MTTRLFGKAYRHCLTVRKLPVVRGGRDPACPGEFKSGSLRIHIRDTENLDQRIFVENLNERSPAASSPDNGDTCHSDIVIGHGLYGQASRQSPSIHKFDDELI